MSALDITEAEVEAAAEAAWRQESVRAAGRRRRISWADEGTEDREKWRGIARSALQAAAAVRPATDDPDLTKLRSQRDEWQRRCRIEAGLLMRAQDRIHRLGTELNRLRQRCADYEDVLADKRRLTRELDMAMHGEAGAAEQASLCDLVGPARDLRARADALGREIEALREVLRRVEWCGTIETTDDEMRTCCPVCEAYWEERRHSSDCALAAALTQTDGGRDGK